MKNIDADFDIFLVDKANKDYYKYNILDSAVYEFKAAAVQYAYGAKALMLFHKGEITEQKFKDDLMKQYKDIKIQKIDLFDSEQCKKYFYTDNLLLAQLLINSMRTPKNEKFTYNNLMGKFLYHDPSWTHRDKSTGEINFIRFLEIVIYPGMYLNLEHKTYRKTKNGKSSLYVIDSKTGDFRRKLETDVNTDVYELGSMPHKKFSVVNFDITDSVHFKKSKMGIMVQILKEIKNKLSKYLTVELEEREDVQTFAISKLEKKGMSEQDYGQILKKKRVVIVDENHSEKSKEMVKRLSEELKRYYDIEPFAGKLTENAYNIRIIHDEEYYAENDLFDPHNDNLKGYIVQHMTEEAEHFSNPKGSSPDIKKIVQELIIKGDVRDKKISIFDWERFDSGKEWAFVIRKKVETIQRENAVHMNYNNKTAHCYYDYYRLRIDCTGKLYFDTFYDGSQREDEEWEKICYAYDWAEDENWKMKNHVDGLVYSDIDNIHAILLTKEKTLPNITALMDTLEKTDVKEKVSKEVLLHAIGEFEILYPEFKQHTAEWRAGLSEETEMFTKKKVKKILNMRCNAASLFNRFLHENYDIWIDGELRKEEFDAVYQIGNLLNIKYEQKMSNYSYENEFFYYVGAKSKKLTYPNACCIRKVVSTGTEVEYEEILPLMAVEFVRNSQYTVLPFPYKYLREYMAQC